LITVCILINGNPIYTRSAVNITKSDSEYKINEYKVDEGSIIEHCPIDGAVELAKKMLDTIKEEK